MPTLFGVDIAAAINSGIGPGLPAVTLQKLTAGDRTAGSLTSGKQPNVTSYQTRGFIEDYNDYQMTNTLIQTGDRKCLIMGKPLSNSNVTPADGDILIVENISYKIIRVKRDPATAAYECQVRGTNVP